MPSGVHNLCGQLIEPRPPVGVPGRRAARPRLATCAVHWRMRARPARPILAGMPNQHDHGPRRSGAAAGRASHEPERLLTSAAAPRARPARSLRMARRPLARAQHPPAVPWSGSVARRRTGAAARRRRPRDRRRGAVLRLCPDECSRLVVLGPCAAPIVWISCPTCWGQRRIFEVVHAATAREVCSCRARALAASGSGEVTRAGSREVR
jgi:hypothetical protein